MTWYTVQAAYASYYANTVTVEADTPEQALDRAIEQANDDPLWKSVDHCGDTFVDAFCVGRDADPFHRDAGLPVPPRFTENGEPPLVTLDPQCPHGTLEVTRGTVQFRFLDPTATVTAERSATPPPPQNKPLVTITRRPDGAPDVDVRGGNAIIRVEGWQPRPAPDDGA